VPFQVPVLELIVEPTANTPEIIGRSTLSGGAACTGWVAAASVLAEAYVL
jgi:hypothetical protein